MEAGHDHGSRRLRQVEDRVGKTPDSGTPDLAPDSRMLMGRLLHRDEGRTNRVQELTAEASLCFSYQD